MPYREASSKRAPQARADLYQRVTNSIVSELEKGVRPWLKPWASAGDAQRIDRPIRSNRLPYRGINILILWASAIENGYTNPMWMSYRQAKELGGQVRKREQSSQIVFVSHASRGQTEADGSETDTKKSFLRSYAVFNVEQIDGLPVAEPSPQPQLPITDRIAVADNFVERTRALVQHAGSHAFYNIQNDAITMPPFQAFQSADAYYGTLVHELTHWTKHPSRIDRDLGGKRFGDEGYAMEELVAELGSAFICADLNLDPTLYRQSASYIDNWLRVLKRDKRAIFTAASLAQKAVDYLHALQSERGTVERLSPTNVNVGEIPSGRSFGPDSLSD